MHGLYEKTWHAVLERERFEEIMGLYLCGELRFKSTRRVSAKN